VCSSSTWRGGGSAGTGSNGNNASGSTGATAVTNGGPGVTVVPLVAGWCICLRQAPGGVEGLEWRKCW